MLELSSKVVPISQILVMAPDDLRGTILDQAPLIKPHQILDEPEMRDNGPAIVLGMLQIQKLDPEAIVTVLWSDHLILKSEQFRSTLQDAFRAAAKFTDYLITIGTKPISANPELGYIQLGKPLNHQLFQVKAFREKPALQEAKQMVKSGQYLWNVGYKVMGVGPFWKQLLKIRPDLKGLLSKLQDYSSPTELRQLYAEMPKESIEYLFTQHLTQIAVLPADLGWSDVGNWQVLHQVLASTKKPDQAQNVYSGKVQLVDCQNTFVQAKTKPIYGMGLHNIAIIDAGDCLFVLNQNSASKVKEVTKLVENQDPNLLD